MTIHFHGTPITPRKELFKMAGRHFCVSFADKRDAEVCVQIGQSVMFDNGAFSVWKQGTEIDWSDFYKWLEPRLGHPHWAIIPDVITGTVEQNRKLLEDWPHPAELSAPVWHTDEPIDWLLELAQYDFGKICFGSTPDYEPGSDAWRERMTAAFNKLAKSGPMPWVHMLRGLAQIKPDGFPFASADSVNVALHFKENNTFPGKMAAAINSVQAPNFWIAEPEQICLLGGTS